MTASHPTTATAADPDLAAPIKAVRLKRPGRHIAAAILLLLAFSLVFHAATNSDYQWNTYLDYLFDRRVERAVLVTIELTAASMLLAIIVGLSIAVMRMSDNYVLHGFAWVFVWIFRGTPVYVQLVFWGLLTTIYHRISLGLPGRANFLSFDAGHWLTAFVLAVLGLGLNEAAYTSEIIRAGIKSVDRGQNEAASALGLTGFQMTRLIVLPQAMRFIVPPVGNEVIGLLKGTSLVIAVPYTVDLYAVTQQIGGVLYRPIPLLLVASTWYLAVTSVLMIGQHFLEKRFARGSAGTEVTELQGSAGHIIAADAR